MEEKLNQTAQEQVVEVEQPNLTPEVNKEETVSFSFSTILEILLYIAGIVLLILCVVKYGQDLDTYRGEFRFSEETYVGGDAYNYIISAARSSAVMVKSLIFAVLGCSSIISGLLIRIANKK